MANKKDLAEAQSYSRRRLVTAFSSGIPDGVELTPKKNQSPVIVGVGLTVIAILVSLFYGMVSPSLPDGWENNKLIVAKNSAARYVSSNGTLHPVINAISARLLIPSSDFKVLTVADDQLKNIPIGSTIGILGAPDSLPEENNLIAGSINSCVSDSNITTTLSNASSQVTDTATAIVANVDGISYLVNGSHRYQLPQEATYETRSSEHSAFPKPLPPTQPHNGSTCSSKEARSNKSRWTEQATALPSTALKRWSAA